jgi:tetratricopeptide (TPR) repeat protein
MVVSVIALVVLQASVASDLATGGARSRAENSSLLLSDRSAAYEQLLRNNPADPSLYAAYASLLIANRDYGRALSWITKGLRVAPSDPGLRLRHAVTLHGLDRYRESLKILEALPPSGESRFYMGLDYRSLNDHKSAQKYLAEAYDLGLRDPYALYSLIEEDRVVKDKPAGLRHYQAFVEQFPGSAWLHVLYANAYMQKDQNPAARKEYQEALRLQPDLPGVNFRLGFLLYKDDQYPAAADCFRKEVALNPSYSDANLFLGQTLRILGKNDEAVVYLRKAIDLDPRSDLGYRALVSILTGKGDLNGAVVVLRKAEKQFPEDAGFPAQLAKILTRLNREEEAFAEQEKFRALKEAERMRNRTAGDKP